MFYFSYVAAELRRRKGRTVLTALGLGVGVALVVAVSALSRGLDHAQAKVLKPLTGLGTDVSVTRPIKLSGGGFRNLSRKEQDELRQENGPQRIGIANRGKPGTRFTNDNFVSTSQLSFSASEAHTIAGLVRGRTGLARDRRGVRRRAGDDRQAAGGPDRRLAVGCQEPVEQARHCARDRRPGRRGADRVPLVAVVGREARARARHAARARV